MRCRRGVHTQETRPRVTRFQRTNTPGVDVRLGREFAGLGDMENCTVLCVRICVEGVV